MARRPHLLETVELTCTWDGWPAGTVGAVVSKRCESAVVEIASEATIGETGLPASDLLDDLISVPYTALHVVAPAPARSR